MGEECKCKLEISLVRKMLTANTLLYNAMLKKCEGSSYTHTH